MKDLDITKNSYNRSAEEYHKNISGKDTNFYHKYLEKPAMISFLKGILKNKNVLDLGCGSGVFTKKLNSFGVKSIVGFDLSKEMINIARRENPNIKFYVGNAKKTPFKNSQFDVVSSSLVAHYFKNLKLFFKEVSRILKKGGYFVFSISHPLIGIRKGVMINGKEEKILLPYFSNIEYRWEIADGSEVVNYQYTFESLVNSLNDVGFIVERVLEPRPPKQTKKLFKKEFERTYDYPSFLIVKARKVK